MATEFILVRHGQTAANRANTIQGQLDIPLDPTGREQGKRLAERLRPEQFACCYTSPLQRARQTAELIAPNCPITILPELMEWNLGDWQGKSFEELERDYPQEFAAFRTDRDEVHLPNGEDKSVFYRRVETALQLLAANAPPQGKVLIVGHGAWLRAALKLILGNPAPWPLMPRTANASLNVFHYHQGRWQLGCWNDAAHVQDLVFRNYGF